MDSMSKTINNHSGDISIHQLHKITIRQQSAINSIQATLVTQQKDNDDIKTTITDMRISINNMIRSVSEIATKLGFQITLPPPLPLSLASPTMLAATVATSTTPPFPLDHVRPSSVSALMQTKSETAILTDPQPTTLQPLLPTPNPAPPVQILRSLSFLPTSVLVPTSSLTNNLPKSLSITNFSSTLLHSTTFCIAYQSIRGAYNEAATSKAFSNRKANWIWKVIIGSKHKLQGEKKVYIFDPGGTLNIKSIADLEDKVDFEGSVMIRILALMHLPIDPDAQLPSQQDISPRQQINERRNGPCEQQQKHLAVITN